MERYEAKIVSLVVIFASILVATMLPIRVEGFFARQGARGRAVLGGISCFSGGLFLATYLLDMAPEVRVLLQPTLMDPNHIKYPVPELIIGAGFFLILLMEIIVMSLTSRNGGEKEEDATSMKGTAGINEVLEAKDLVAMTVMVDRPAVDADTGNAPTARLQQQTLTAEQATATTRVPETTAVSSVKTAPEECNGESREGAVVASSLGKTNSGFASNVLKTNEVPAGENSEATSPSVREIRQSNDDSLPVASTNAELGHAHAPVDNSHLTRSIILVLALSLDSIFEGMALGLKTTMQGVWNLLIAIVAHEVVIAFSMGMQLIRHQTRRSVAIIAILYSLMSPIGGAIGATLMETQGRSATMDMTNGILQGLTAGIFIYVTFFEILSTEFVQGVTYTRITTTFLGFCVMAALKAIPDGSEAVRHMAANGTAAG